MTADLCLFPCDQETPRQQHLATLSLQLLLWSSMFYPLPSSSFPTQPKYWAVSGQKIKKINPRSDRDWVWLTASESLGLTWTDYLNLFTASAALQASHFQHAGSAVQRALTQKRGTCCPWSQYNILTYLLRSSWKMQTHTEKSVFSMSSKSALELWSMSMGSERPVSWEQTGQLYTLLIHQWTRQDSFTAALHFHVGQCQHPQGLAKETQLQSNTLQTPDITYRPCAAVNATLLSSEQSKIFLSAPLHSAGPFHTLRTQPSIFATEVVRK